MPTMPSNRDLLGAPDKVGGKNHSQREQEAHDCPLQKIGGAGFGLSGHECSNADLPAGSRPFAQIPLRV